MQGDSCGPIPAAVLSVDVPDHQYHFYDRYSLLDLGCPHVCHQGQWSLGNCFSQVVDHLNWVDRHRARLERGCTPSELGEFCCQKCQNH